MVDWCNSVVEFAVNTESTRGVRAYLSPHAGLSRRGPLAVGRASTWAMPWPAGARWEGRRLGRACARVGRAALACVARRCGPSRAMWAEVENPVFLFFQRIEMLNYFCYESHFDKS